MSQQDLTKTNRLFHALGELCLLKEYSAVRVEDIAEKGRIHRATFYRHYESKEDLLERGTEIFWDRMLREMEGHRNTEEEERGPIPSYLIHFFDEIEKNRPVFRAFFHPRGSLYFRNRSRERIVEFIRAHRLVAIEEEDRRTLVSAMISASLLTAIEKIAETDGGTGPIRETYYSFVSRGAYYFLKTGD